ncbi:hypothetical protein M0D21_06765 [Aquimarina sp. D1M17]|uniref:hypothetical protein n=1 Tax=Aquimarina acroporae TaxID=2937283 RepID=UPI0020BEC553|nr:hypothetical protein [Aquimarina acroporae]MCK8521259.1 hypothetical protein [Aquimarina acroporae]
MTAFLFLRIADIHAFSHFSDDDHQIDCELCEIITTSHKLTLFSGDVFVEEDQKSITVFPTYNIDFTYNTSKYSATLPKSVYNKPPPFFY